MTWSVASEIERAAGDLGIPCRKLEAPEANRIWGEVESRYASGRGLLFVERLTGSTSSQGPGGWTHVPALVGAGPVWVLTDKDGREVFAFSSADDFIRASDECPFFEFYVVPHDLSSIVAFNHHDFLIACGEARSRFREVVGPPDGEGGAL